MNPAEPLEAATAPLFVPATRPERFVKALNSGAELVIVDLEDAVAFSEKDAAREILRERIPELAGQGPLGVRVNSARSEHLRRDVEVIGDIAESLSFVVLPDVQRADDVLLLQDLLRSAGGEAAAGIPLLALIESSAGILHAPEIARLVGVRRLALGAADLSEEWEIEPSEEEREFDIARQQLVIASRAAGLNGPLDSPHMNVGDAAGLSRRTAAVAGLGVRGKLCIHPDQVAEVQSAFVVSAAEYGRLKRLIESFEQAESRGDASVRLPDGDFVDYPVYRRAVKKVLAYERVHH